MGTVYRAVDEASGQTVAVKTLHSHLSADTEYVRRFEREVRIAQSIDSPNVVKVLDSGHEGETFYLVMEYVQGESLADHINQRGKLPITDTVSIATAITKALVASNARSIVHRDISPQNVIITQAGEAKVTDFGVSKDLSQTVFTATSMLLGKPLYIAPEVVTGAARADIRADIYALGIIMFQMLAGEVPFNAETPYAVMQKHVNEPTPALRSLRSDVPVWLVNVIEKCLAKDPATRYQQPAEILDDLQPIEDQATVIVPKDLAAGDATVFVTTPTRQSAEPVPATGQVQIQLRALNEGGGGKTGEYELVLRNTGAQAVALHLDAADNAKALLYSMPGQRTVEPGKEDVVPFTVQARSRRLVGAKQRIPFSVYASGGGSGPPLTANGFFADEPPAWVPFAAVGAVVAALVLGVAGVMAMSGGGDNGDKDLAKADTTVTSPAGASSVSTPTPRSSVAILPATQTPVPPPPTQPPPPPPPTATRPPPPPPTWTPVPPTPLPAAISKATYGAATFALEGFVVNGPKPPDGSVMPRLTNARASGGTISSCVAQTLDAYFSFTPLSSNLTVRMVWRRGTEVVADNSLIYYAGWDWSYATLLSPTPGDYAMLLYLNGNLVLRNYISLRCG
jgi:hypothetical protein